MLQSLCAWCYLLVADELPKRAQSGALTSSGNVTYSAERAIGAKLSMTHMSELLRLSFGKKDEFMREKFISGNKILPASFLH